MTTLEEAVRKDCENDENCFNPNGCDHEFHRTINLTPDDRMYKYSKTSCKRVSKCQHKYCDAYKKIIDLIKHYSTVTGKSETHIIDLFEKYRGYNWYLNFYNRYPFFKDGTENKHIDTKIQEFNIDLKGCEYKLQFVHDNESLKNKIHNEISEIKTNIDELTIRKDVFDILNDVYSASLNCA